jgi:hypothetical protein
MKLETAAFGYLRERLYSEQRVAGNDLWLSATCAVLVPASDGLMLFQILAGVFVPLICHRDAKFHPDEEPEMRRRRIRSQVCSPAQLTHKQHSGTISESARLTRGR